ncbi:sensor histidine kinase [Roseomonas sp. WA12]
MRDDCRDTLECGPKGPTAAGLGFLHGAGHVAGLIRRLDAASCPLGAVEEWSATLRSVLGTVLPARAQIVVFWGEDYVALYNDAYAPSIGDKHPRALGRPARESWGELWDTLAPMLDGVRTSGETLHARDLRFLTDRHGYLEEVFFDISYSAVHEGATVAGVLCIVTETTGRVLAARRMDALRGAALRLAAATSPESACAAALETLVTQNPADLPWARILLVGSEGLAEVAAHGTAAATGHPVAPEMEDAVSAVLRDATPREVPGGLALPLVTSTGVAGVFLAGLNPNLLLAGDYGGFLGLAAGQISLAVTRLRREEEERRTAALLRESEALFRNMADHVPVMIWMTEPDGRCSYLNRRWYDFTGQSPGDGLGYGWADMVHPEDRALASDTAARSMAAGRPFQIEYRLRAADGSYGWVIDAARPRLDGQGRFAGFIGSVLDIGDRRRAEEARDLLSRELSHRIKNIFMVTGGLAALTARGDPAAAAFAGRLQARLRALSLAHDLVRPELPAGPTAGGMPVTGPAPQPPTLHGLIRALLAPYSERIGDGTDLARVAVMGADGPVGFAAANALALVLHEQATNAVKYGALSTTEGRLCIETRLDDGALWLEWRETGGPRVAGPPERPGFGTLLAGRSLSGQVGGWMDQDWRSEGLVVRLSVPATGLAR